MILCRPGSILTRPVSMMNENKENPKDVQPSFGAHKWVKLQRVHTILNLSPCHRNKTFTKGQDKMSCLWHQLKWKWSRMWSEVMAKCSPPSHGNWQKMCANWEGAWIKREQHSCWAMEPQWRARRCVKTRGRKVCEYAHQTKSPLLERAVWKSPVPSGNPTKVISANCDLQTNEEATIHIKDLGSAVPVQFFEDTLAVLSLG